MGSVYAIANQKGGVGKTTTAVNIAGCGADAGNQVLICDLDSQCNATVALGLGREAGGNVDGGGGLSHPALLVRDCINEPHQAARR